MPYTLRPGARIFYELEGASGQPVVTLLNGFGRSSTDFRLFSRRLIERGFQVLRLDNRGVGKTENTGAFSLNEMVDDVLETWVSLGIQESHLVGISYGGVLALLTTHKGGNRVKSLALVSTTPSSFFMGVDNDLSSQTEAEIEANLAKYFSPRFKEHNTVLYRSLIKETAKTFLDPKSRERAKEQRNALRVFDFTPLLHSIHCPTLILHGEDDEVVKPEAAEVLHRSIKGSELTLVPEVGHLFLAESPKLFYDSVSDFFQAQA
jgi:3-oxoadipate enol-lactonase